MNKLPPVSNPQNTKPQIKRRGLLFVLSSPSGAGKTTLSKRLLEDDDNLSLSVSVTTRAPRPGEQEGIDYYFIDQATYVDRRARGELLESAKVFGNYYGTPRPPVMQMLERGTDMLFDIDWQGAKQLSEAVLEDLVRVFILPPSGASLEERLYKRNQDAADVVAGRMAQAASEISHWNEYDYVVVNSDIDDSLALLRNILNAERAKRERQTGLPKFVDAMIEDLQNRE